MALLTTRQDFLRVQLEAYRKDIEKTQGALEELMVTMDSDGLAVRVGSTFFNSTEDFASEHLTGIETGIEQKKALCERELEEIETKLTVLKARLSNKFGDGIGLD